MTNRRLVKKTLKAFLYIIIGLLVAVIFWALLPQVASYEESPNYYQTSSLYLKGNLIPPQPQTALKSDPVLSDVYACRYSLTNEECTHWKNRIIYWANYYGNNTNLALCLITNESGFDPKAQNSISSAGGIGQFIDGTWLSTVDRMNMDWTLADKKNGEKASQAFNWLLKNDGYTHWVVWPGCV